MSEQENKETPKILIADAASKSFIDSLKEKYGEENVDHRSDLKGATLETFLKEQANKYDVISVRSSVLPIGVTPKENGIVIRRGAGTKNIQSLEDCTENNVAVCNAPGDGTVWKGNSNGVAEAIIASLNLQMAGDMYNTLKNIKPEELDTNELTSTNSGLGILNRIIVERKMIAAFEKSVEVHESGEIKKGNYNGHEVVTRSGTEDGALKIMENMRYASPLNGAKIGIVSSTSSHANIMAEYAARLGMEVFVQSRSLEYGKEKDGQHFSASVDDMINKVGTNGIISLHQASGTITKEQLGKMADLGITLVNFGRHNLLDEEADLKGLFDKGLKYIVDDEIEVLRKIPLHDNCLRFPHIGAETKQAGLNVESQTLEAIQAWQQNIVIRQSCKNHDGLREVTAIDSGAYKNPPILARIVSPDQASGVEVKAQQIRKGA
ncbi:MAG TPA: hypothetical protein DIV86_06050 [Alphaproteobacteria bacterium]|nr:hypothetical protein [Alphaproteobacteria bacterium]